MKLNNIIYCLFIIYLLSPSCYNHKLVIEKKNDNTKKDTILSIKKEKVYKNQIFNYGLEDANLTKLELAKKIQNHIKNLKIEIDEFASDPDKRDYIVSNAKILSTGWKTKYNLDFGQTITDKIQK